MSSLHSGHFGLPERDRATQIRAGLGAFLFALAGAATIWLSVLYVNRGAVASGPSSNRLFSYQITLTDANGIALTGTQSVILNFYTVPTGGTPIHTDCGTTGTPVARKAVMERGIATVIIGDTGAGASHNCVNAAAPNAVPANLFSNTTLYLGVTVGADAEMTPRRRIVSSGYAANADLLDDLDTSAVGGSVAFVPVTDSSGNLVLTKNFTVDTGTLFVDSSANLVSINSLTPVTGSAVGLLTITETAGTNIPLVVHANHAIGAEFYTHSNTGFRAPTISLLRSEGTAAAPTAISIAERLGYIGFGGHDGSGYFGGSEISSSSTGAWNGTSHGTDLYFSTTASGTTSLVERMRLAHDGNVGIGDTSPAYKLEVGGDIASSAAIRDAISWIQNQGGADKLRLGFNNGGAGASATPGNTAMRADDVEHYNAGASDTQVEGFRGAIFDGRYVYFIPYYYKKVLRYDTSGTFSSSSSWSTFDYSAVSASFCSEGGTFDGRYIYLSPCSGGGVNGLVMRYDTTAPFSTAGSWSTFNMATVNASALGYNGASFDGRYAYFVPRYNGANHGLVMRYDTTASFTAGASWASFNAATVSASAVGFHDAVFDGRYLYFIPTVSTSIVLRYDTTGNFTSSGSWTTFDQTTVNASAKGFRSGTYDGRYVYFVPYNNGTYNGNLLRYDTSSSFTATTSWTHVDITSFNASAKGFSGATFDGRYVHFVPYWNATPDASGVIARLDTAGTITSSSAWSFLDIETIDGALEGYVGSAFDGRHIYFVPLDNSVDDGENGRVAKLRVWSGGADSSSSLVKIARSEELFIDPAGKVGIGTVSPTVTLHTVVQQPSATNGPNANSFSAARFMVQTAGGGPERGIELGAPTSAISNAPVYVKVQGSSNRFGILNEDNVERLSISSFGNVGIGNTTPAARLDVVGGLRLTGRTAELTGDINPIASTAVTGVNTQFTAELVVGDRITVSGETRTVTAIASNTSLTVDTAFTDTANDTTPDAVYALATIRDSSTAIKLTMNDLGNIGIGTILPTTELQVSGTTDVFRIADPTATSYVSQEWEVAGSVMGRAYGFGASYTTSGRLVANSLLIDATAAGGLGLSAASTAPINFYTATAQRMIIESGGNVGIGDFTPASLFTVGSGDQFRVDSSGNVTTNGDVTIEGGDIITTQATFNLLAGATTVNIAGGSGSTGCTVDGSGNLSCSGAVTGGGTGFVNNGNSFAGAATLGTNDAFALNFETNNITYLTIASGGGFTLPVDTDWTLTGGTNGLSFDGTTFSVDAANNRIGIGTASPRMALEIFSAGDVAWNLHKSSVAENTWGVSGPFGTSISLFNTNADKYEFRTGQDGTAFPGSGDARLTILATNGNIGIGDANPAALLTVGSGDLFQVNSSGAIAATTGIVNSGNTTLGDATSDTITFTARAASSLLPSADDAYDLGSSANRWRDVYVGPASLHIGANGDDASIGYDTVNNRLTFDANNDGTAESFLDGSGSLQSLSGSGSIQNAYGGLGSFQNMAYGSSYFGGSNWTRTGGVTVSSNQADPAGTTDGKSIIDDGTGGGTVEQTRTITAAASQPYTFSVWIKDSNTVGTISIQVSDLNGTGPATSTTTIDPTSQWQRYSVTHTPPSNTTSIKLIINHDSTASDTFYAWGAQLEKGTTAGPYVNTSDGGNGSTAASTRHPGATFNGDLLVAGYSNITTVPLTGAGYRMMFLTGFDGAFRAGYVGGDSWDASNIGFYSTAFGYNNKASGDGSTALGRDNVASGIYSTISGYEGSATGQASTAFGDNVDATGNFSVAMGSSITASGINAVGFGNQVTASSNYTVAMGRFASATAANAISIGLGVDNTNRMVNSTASSFGVGFNSTVPTLLVTAGSGVGTYGKVGIGVASPSVTLDVSGTATSDFIQNITNTSTANTADGLSIKLGPATNPGTGNSFVSFKDGSGSVVGQIQGDGAGNITYTTTSDSRLKENVVPYDGALAAVNAMQVKTYNMVTAPGKPQYGFIAQELFTVIPQVVSVGGDDPKSEPWTVDYGRITPVLARAIQELDAKLVALSELDAESTVALGAFSSPLIEAEKVTADAFAVRRTDDRKTIGDATLPSGEIFTQVHDASILPGSKVFFSFRKNPGSYGWIEEVGEGFFVLKVAQPTVEEVRFDYWIIDVVDETTPVAEPEPELVPEPIVEPEPEPETEPVSEPTPEE